MKSSWLNSIVFGLVSGCSTPLEPEAVADADPSDVVVSGSGLLLAGVVTAVLTPKLDPMRFESQRSECEHLVDAIRVAELSYGATYAEYLEVTDYVPDDEPGPELRSWPEESSFDTLDWSPAHPVRGSYKVSVEPWGAFVVHCITDVDGDGEQASWTATRSIQATLNTAPDVY